MMSNLENYNYWNDPRVRAGMIDKPKVVDENGSKYIVLELEDDEGEAKLLKLLCKWEVCETCEGDGTHVNPSIDSCGLTSEDFFEDPDFAEGYSSGRYDQTCNGCGGLRVCPVVNRDLNPKSDVEAYDEYIQEEYAHAAEVAAERAMGA